jgi:hypothetical protein
METDNNAFPDNDDEDLDSQDRGDVVDDDTDKGDDADKDDGKKDDADDEDGADKDDADKDEAPDKKDDKARDDKGRFAKKDDKSDEDEDDEGEDDEDDEDADKKQNLPIRLNKARQQRDAARTEAAQLRARVEALEKASKKDEIEDPADAINAKLDGLYEQVEEARADGDAKAAAKLQREIDGLNRQLTTLEAEKVATRTSTVMTENERYNALLDTLEADIDVLNPNHDDFDPQAVKSLEWYTAAHEKMGMSADKALRQAARVVFGYGGAKPDVKKAADKKDDKKAPDKKPDAKKAADTNKRQPPDLSDRGVNKDDQEIDPDKLDDAEWDKLPESKKAQLRGDNG